jgi:excisionase family DNA binding protein
MSYQDKLRLLYQSLEKYPASLDPDQVAEALGISRRTVDRLLDAGKIEFFVIDETKERKDKRVTKAALVEFMQRQAVSPEIWGNGESLNQ